MTTSTDQHGGNADWTGFFTEALVTPSSPEPLTEQKVSTQALLELLRLLHPVRVPYVPPSNTVQEAVVHELRRQLDPLFYWMGKHRLNDVRALRSYLAANHPEFPQKGPGRDLATISKLLEDDWRRETGCLKQQSLTPDGGGGQPKGSPKADSTARSKRGTVGQRVLEQLQRDPASVKWSQQKWSQFLGCAPSAVAQSEAWQTIMTARKMYEVERAEREQK